MAYRIDPSSPLSDNVIRIVGELSDEVSNHLDAASSDHARRLHQARKAIKRLRALLRLVRSAAPAALKACDIGFGDAARAVAGPREATALVETLERLIAAYPGRIVDARLGEIRAILIRRSEHLGVDGTLEQQVAAARFGIDRTSASVLKVDLSRADADTLHHGMRKILKKWSAALDRARRDKQAEAFHDLRKAVKAHAAQLALLEAFWPGDWRKRRKAVDELGEVLGDLNDIHVMIGTVRNGSLDLPDSVDTACLVKLLRKELRGLARRALAGAEDQLANVPAGLNRRFRAITAETASVEAA